MKEHVYLMDIDRLVARSWMFLLHLDDLMSFLENVQVELLDVLHYMQISMKSNINPSSYKVCILKDY